MENTGYYKCKKCNLIFHMITNSRHRGYCYPRKIKRCPHCNNSVIMCTESKFKSFEYKSWLRLNKNKIEYSMKFG